MTITDAQIQRGLLLFWSVWFFVVAMTNLADGLIAAGVLPADWRLASGNYLLVKQVTARYGTPGWIPPPMFAGVVLWESTACALFTSAWMAWGGGEDRGRARARLAYAAAMGLWGSFLVLDEFFIAYEFAAPHLRLLIAQIVCLIALVVTERRRGVS